MSAFPPLKTGAVTQYPAERVIRYSSDVLRFVDGTEQRFRTFASPLRQWVIRLDLLDEGEIAAIRNFFSAQSGINGIFSFTDPEDGVLYPSCSLDQDELDTELLEEVRGRAMLTIRENRV